MKCFAQWSRWDGVSKASLGEPTSINKEEKEKEKKEEEDNNDKEDEGDKVKKHKGFAQSLGGMEFRKPA